MFLVALVHVLHVYYPSLCEKTSTRQDNLGKNIGQDLVRSQVLLFLATTLIYLNRIQNVNHHSIANARAILSALSK